ncbi:hypothetical protein R1sor_012853 [Riccia sorocarpa]|uniref:Uncharacterized protein n=1 Tax=Riccia sorocarpa TaxID=122646 RepID=A0ABD3I4W6_9MARC
MTEQSVVSGIPCCCQGEETEDDKPTKLDAKRHRRDRSDRRAVRDAVKRSSRTAAASALSFFSVPFPFRFLLEQQQIGSSLLMLSLQTRPLVWEEGVSEIVLRSPGVASISSLVLLLAGGRRSARTPSLAFGLDCCLLLCAEGTSIDTSSGGSEDKHFADGLSIGKWEEGKRGRKDIVDLTESGQLIAEGGR